MCLAHPFSRSARKGGEGQGPSSCPMKPNPFWSLNHLTVPLVIITSSFLKNFQRRRLEDATLTNGLFLQNETVSPIKDGTLFIEERITFLLAESKLIINLF